MNIEYKEAAGEALQVLQSTDNLLVEKVPKMLLEFWKRNAVYSTKWEENQSIDLKEVKPKTRALLGMIYRNYWCTPEERKEFDLKLKENEIKFQEEARQKYNPDNIFKDKEIEKIGENETTELAVYKENVFLKIINKIKSIFKKYL